MPQNEPALSIQHRFISELLQDIGVEQSIYRIFKFLARFIPASKIFCLNINRKQKTLNTLISYSIDSYENSPYSVSAPLIMSWENVLALPHGHPDNVIIINNPDEDAALHAWIFNYNAELRSVLSILLNVDEQADTLFSVLLGSPEPETYTNEHAAILASFRDILEDLLEKFFLSDNEPYLSISADGPHHVAPEMLLRNYKGLTPAMRLVDTVASRKTSVLLRGASGTGKELFAETIHALSPRKDRPLVKVNCGSIPETLLESELFGHEKGAFTGANSSRPGYFEQAQGGTLYLDEVGELTPSAQVRLLRALENREIRRVGGIHSIQTDVRIIAATHQDLEGMVARGAFREDLWYRLNVFAIPIPSLSQRVEDIPQLVEYFYNAYVREHALTAPPKLTRQMLQDLSARPWPGNVRQLRYAVERALLISAAAGLKTLQLAEQDKIPPDTRSSRPSARRGRPRRAGLTPEKIRQALEKAAGRIQGKDGAAELLGVSPSTLRSRMQAQGIPLPKDGTR